MTTWIDPIRPNHSVSPYKVVAAAAGISPYGPPGRTLQGDRLPIEVNVPPAGVEGQHGQIAAPAGTAQVDGSMLVADPELAGFDCVELGQYIYEDGTEVHGRHAYISLRAGAMRGVSSRNLWRNEVDSETYCSVRRRHSITASAAANAFTSGSWTFR